VDWDLFRHWFPRRLPLHRLLITFSRSVLSTKIHRTIGPNGGHRLKTSQLGDALSEEGKNERLFVIGVDCGTESARVGLFDSLTGELVSSGVTEYNSGTKFTNPGVSYSARVRLLQLIHIMIICFCNGSGRSSNLRIGGIPSGSRAENAYQNP
jgi:hypothetical protein